MPGGRPPQTVLQLSDAAYVLRLRRAHRPTSRATGRQTSRRSRDQRRCHRISSSVLTLLSTERRTTSGCWLALQMVKFAHSPRQHKVLRFRRAQRQRAWLCGQRTAISVATRSPVARPAPVLTLLGRSVNTFGVGNHREAASSTQTPRCQHQLVLLRPLRGGAPGEVSHRVLDAGVRRLHPAHRQLLGRQNPPQPPRALPAHQGCPLLTRPEVGQNWDRSSRSRGDLEAQIEPPVAPVTGTSS